MSQALRDYFARNPASGLEIVRLTPFEQGTVEAFLQAWYNLEWDAEADQA